MATYGNRLAPGRRGQVLFFVFTRQRWRGLLFGGLLLAFASLLVWQNVRDDDFGSGAGTAAGADKEVVAVMGGTVVPASGGVLQADGNMIADPRAVVRVSNPDDVALSDPITSVAVQISEVHATNIPPPRVHPFDELRLERERTRSRQTEALQQAANDVTSPAEEREAARVRLQQLWTQTLREAELEHLLEAQGHIAVVVLSGDRVQVVVDALLDATAATRIGELVGRVAGVRREDISIVDSLSSGG